MARRLIALALLMALPACAGDPRMMNISQPRRDGPDEFAVAPSKPLEMPQTYAALPPPTPGGSNRVDQTPIADATIALGGRPEVLTRASGDGALVSYAGRYGVDPSIRPQLATADAAFRADNQGRLLERVFNVNVYYRAYEEMSLDQHRELERLRRAGIRTPSAPPPAAAGG